MDENEKPDTDQACGSCLFCRMIGAFTAWADEQEEIETTNVGVTFAQVLMMVADNARDQGAPDDPQRAFHRIMQAFACAWNGLVEERQAALAAQAEPAPTPSDDTPTKH